MGLRRRALAGPRRVLRPRRLRDGHASHARDRVEERLSERLARLHGVEPGHGAAALLEALPQRRLHAARNRAGARALRPGVRLPRVPEPDPRRVLFDHHAGVGAQRLARVQPQRDEPRRDQRARRLQDGLRLPAESARDPARALRGHGARAGRRVRALPLDHADARRQGPRRDPRQRDARAVLRILAGRLQALRVRGVGGARRGRRRPLRAPGRYHHAGEDRRPALDRDGRVGGGRRAGHALRRGAGRVRRQLDPELAHHELPRPVAPLPGRALHGRGLVLPRRHRRRPRPPDSARPPPPHAEKREITGPSGFEPGP